MCSIGCGIREDWSGVRRQAPAPCTNFRPGTANEESQRDSASKPRVARNELPWGMSASAHQLRRSCAASTNCVGFGRGEQRRRRSPRRAGLLSHKVRMRTRRLARRPRRRPPAGAPGWSIRARRRPPAPRWRHPRGGRRRRGDGEGPGQGRRVGRPHPAPLYLKLLQRPVDGRAVDRVPPPA